MRGINPVRIPYFVKKDVELIKKEAVLVLRIKKDGEIEVVNESSKKRIDVIGIIGPVEKYAVFDSIFQEHLRGHKFEEALLCEIGLKRDKPYNQSQNRRRECGESKNFCKRRKWFQMSQNQFMRVAPVIFQILQEITNKRVNDWKCGPKNPYIVKTIRYRIRKSGRILTSYDKFTKCVRGIRFSISPQDYYLLSTVYWAEFNNSCLEKYLSGLARFIDKRLSHYRNNGFRKNFRKLKGFKDVKEMVEKRKIPFYFIKEMFEYLPSKNRNVFYRELNELFGFGMEETECQEKKLAESVLFNVEKILNGLQLKITKSLNNGKPITFEVFPSQNLNKGS